MFGWFKKQSDKDFDRLIKVLKTLSNITITVKIDGPVHVENRSQNNQQSGPGPGQYQSSITPPEIGSSETRDTTSRAPQPLPDFGSLPKPKVSFGEEEASDS
jgi:hypothetical protein